MKGSFKEASFWGAAIGIVSIFAYVILTDEHLKRELKNQASNVMDTTKKAINEYNKVTNLVIYNQNKHIITNNESDPIKVTDESSEVAWNQNIWAQVEEAVLIRHQG